MRVKQQAALSDTRPLRLPEPTAQPAGPVRSRSAPSPRLCHASRLCVGPRAPRGAAGSTPAAAKESARPCGAAVRAAAWLHAVGFGVRDFVAVVRKASFLCVVLVTCTLSRGVPVVVCVFTPLRTAEGKRSPRPGCVQCSRRPRASETRQPPALQFLPRGLCRVCTGRFSARKQFEREAKQKLS